MPVGLPSCSWVTRKNSDYLQDIILINVKLEHTSSTKLLGLYIETNLGWEKHITSVTKSPSSKIGLYLRLGKCLKFVILCKLYFTIVVPHLATVFLSIWGNSPSLISFKSFKIDWQGSSQELQLSNSRTGYC